jgi:class 3 adenylate cyclase/tetratricopeptide (TPR) repeat protein
MAEPRRERKVVTVLFADLVGFTARAEALDPEDVEAILRPYHERLRSELERFGGTVEKFIGDAVMALFGAPVAHEDDPERAVRAALAIRDWAREDGEVQVRVAVNTGEALINLTARADAGEGMAAGDVVNTTARLQTAAPVNGVLVGETTYRATQDAIDFHQAEPVEAKGKAEPVRVWEALEPRSRVGSEAVSTRVPLVGRQRELDQLVDAFERVRQERSAQLVTLVGVPGIGKSRLVAELLAHVEALPDFVFWRHGRSLPYGEGVAFWALGEMVKAQAGIVENDSAEEVARKLALAVEECVGESDRPWVESKLRPLVGLGGEAGEREESFAAWRAFFEGLAEQGPLVMVFEDLHWSGDELLDFVDTLPDWSADVPLLVLCTARPELLDRRANWGGGKRNALTISLSSLDADDTARLVAALLERAVLPADTQSELLSRAGGNPLYAEQFARMYAERGELAAEMPETVQGIIAARLDSLPEDQKRLLQDAAVFGKVFWTGALTAIGGSDRSVAEQHLRALQRKEFVRRERRAAVEGESEYSFGHIIVRDVAYGQIPRSERADKHVRAAEWIESLGREDDQAELLAHHYGSALELMRAAGRDAGDLPLRTRAALRAAGARALALSAFPAAASFFAAARELGGEPDPERPRALLQHGMALHALLDSSRFDVLEAAQTAFAAAGDTEGAAEADLVLAEARWWNGDRESCMVSLARAEALVRDAGDSDIRASVLSQLARFQHFRGENEAAVENALEGLRLSELLGREDLRAKNLTTLGSARGFLADPDLDGAIADLQAGVDVAAASGDLAQLARARVNLGAILELSGRLSEASAALDEVRRLAIRRGHAAALRFYEGNFIDSARLRGDWEAAEHRAQAFLRQSEQTTHYCDSMAIGALATVRLARGDADAAALAERAVEHGRHVADPQALIPALALGAFVYAELGVPDRGRSLLDEIEPMPFIAAVPDAFFAAARLGVNDEWTARTRECRRKTPYDTAADAVLDGRWREAADVYDEMGARPYAALASLRAAEVLVAEGRRAEADEQLARALAFWRSVGATRYVREGEALLAATA